MQKIKVILLSGYARSGKDTISDYIYNTVRLNYFLYKKENLLYRDKFAKPLYDMLSVIYKDCKDEINYDYINECKSDLMPLTSVSWRTALQKLGTEFGRDCLGQHIWADLAVQRSIALCQNKNYNGVIFSDCRFLNEVDRFKLNSLMDVVLIYVERKESEPQLQHRSEQEILKLKNNADYIVTNNKSLKCLYKQIDVILNDLELI